MALSLAVVPPFEFQLVIILTICTTLAFILNTLLKKFNLPTVLGPLIVGLIINWLVSADLLVFLPKLKDIVSSFASLGVILLLFLLGLKINFQSIKSLSKNSSIIALNAGLIPFLVGFFTASILGFSAFESIFIGVCLSITAEEVSLSILSELDLVRKRIGKLIIEAGALGDIFEIYIVAILGIIIRSTNLGQRVNWFNIAAELVAFVVLIVILRYYLVPFMLDTVGDKPKRHELLLGGLFILFVTTFGSEILNFGYFVGALAAGIIIKDKLLENKEYDEGYDMINVIEIISFGFFEPLVFIWIGLSMDLNGIFLNPWIGILFTVIATVGKIVGAMVGNYFCGDKVKEGFLMGWALNSRGATELFAIIIARNLNIIDPVIFNAIVFMALATTIFSPIVFKILVQSRFSDDIINLPDENMKIRHHEKMLKSVMRH